MLKNGQTLCMKGLKFITFKSSRPGVFLGKGVLKKAVNLQENTSVWVLSCKLAAYFQNTFSWEHF